jgi:hypothetical protein
MEVRVHQPAVGDAIDVRCLDQPPNSSIAEKTSSRTLGAPAGAIGWEYGAQSGFESWMSTFTTPLNEMLTMLSVL